MLTQMYPPHHHGGYELLCRDVVERWESAGHEIEVLTTTYRRAGQNDASPRVPVRRELGFYWNDYRILTPPLPTRWATERKNQRALAAALSEFRPDVVSVWHMGAMSFGLLQAIAEHGIPMVFVVGDDWLVYGPAVDAWTKLFTERPRAAWAVRRITGLPTAFAPCPDDFVACFASAFLRDRALRSSTLLLARTDVVPHGIDTAVFPRRTNDPPWSWRLLYVGRVEERKGTHIALEALGRLPENAQLDVIGSPDDRYLERLHHSADRLGVADRVRFLGPIDRERLSQYFHAADAFLFPVIWDEPFGLVPLEAMASGTPVIATGTGGSSEYLTHESNCLLVPPGDADALAVAIKRLAGDDALLRSLTDRGRSTAERLTVDKLAQALDAWNNVAMDGFRRDGADR